MKGLIQFGTIFAVVIAEKLYMCLYRKPIVFSILPDILGTVYLVRVPVTELY